MAMLKPQPNKARMGPKELAAGLASRAQQLRKSLNQALAEESDDGLLHQCWRSLEKEISNLSTDKFTDLFAQITVYTLFAQQYLQQSANRRGGVFPPFEDPARFSRAGKPRPYNDLIDELNERLNQIDFDKVFGEGENRAVRLIHFYEDFLASYDPQLRQSRGVYYTPVSVVAYIVQSVDYLLRRDFGLTDGLANKVQILDPACGTGIFLSHVITHLQNSFENNRDMWPDYVSKQLLSQLSGFELLPVTYAIAQMLLSLQLAESGFVFQEGERLNIRLANALEEENLTLKAGEALVVLGNPPYSGVSANMAGYSARSIADYKIIDGKPLKERKHWLQDDYVKFIRFGQQAIEQVGSGVLAFVSNHSYLDNPTFRGMRQSLLRSFDEIYLLDLHGNAKKQERRPDGSHDVNVFEIQQGVAIGIFVKRPGENKDVAKIYHADLWGSREYKYDWLQSHNLATTEWDRLESQAPYYLFVPQNNQYAEEYANGWSIADIMPLNTTGVLTARDHFVIDFEDEPLLKRITTFLDPALDDAQVQQQLNLNENYAWRVGKARQQLRAVENWKSRIRDIEYRPFDTRRILYDGSVVWRVRDKVMCHIQRPNLGLVCARQQSLPGEWALVGATTRMIESAYISNKTAEINYLFPLYLYSTDSDQRTTNFKPDFVVELGKQLKLAFIADGRGDLATTFGPEDIFYYIYAILHAPSYRRRYAEFLKLDFPRLPLTANLALFRALVSLGGALVKLHTNPKPDSAKVTFPIAGSNRVEAVKYDEQDKVWINKTQYFEGINSDVWGFKMGSYQVCQKWLKDRKGRTLSNDDLQHYHKIVATLSQTISLMSGIDETIVKHGGWPLGIE